MKATRNRVINSNINHFCWPDMLAKAHITRIIPDKFTFLNSNLIVSNIISHLSPTKLPDTASSPDAYVPTP